jgi:hypothetical protein
MEAARTFHKLKTTTNFWSLEFMSWLRFQLGTSHEKNPYDLDRKGETQEPLRSDGSLTGQNHGDRHPKIASDGGRIDPVDSPEIPELRDNSLDLEPAQNGKPGQLLPKPIRKKQT